MATQYPPYIRRRGTLTVTPTQAFLNSPAWGLAMYQKALFEFNRMAQVYRLGVFMVPADESLLPYLGRGLRRRPYRHGNLYRHRRKTQIGITACGAGHLSGLYPAGRRWRIETLPGLVSLPVVHLYVCAPQCFRNISRTRGTDCGAAARTDSCLRSGRERSESRAERTHARTASRSVLYRRSLSDGDGRPDARRRTTSAGGTRGHRASTASSHCRHGRSVSSSRTGCRDRRSFG